MPLNPFDCTCVGVNWVYILQGIFGGIYYIFGKESKSKYTQMQNDNYMADHMTETTLL